LNHLTKKTWFKTYIQTYQTNKMIIIGIDPGTATTGYGIIKKIKKGNQVKCLCYGTIETSSLSDPGERLKTINKELEKLIKKHKPEAMAIERLYFFKNAKTVIPVSQAKGVILLTAAKNKIPIYEFTPLQMKMAIAGFGRAEKKQVQKMIKEIFNLKEIPKPDDAADALGIAMCLAIINDCYLSKKA
jgi:crossover junction endodeoxyribonuclease RuvC